MKAYLFGRQGFCHTYAAFSARHEDAPLNMKCATYGHCNGISPRDRYVDYFSWPLYRRAGNARCLASPPDKPFKEGDYFFRWTTAPLEMRYAARYEY